LESFWWAIVTQPPEPIRRCTATVRFFAFLVGPTWPERATLPPGEIELRESDRLTAKGGLCFFLAVAASAGAKEVAASIASNATKATRAAEVRRAVQARECADMRSSLSSR
jgi:hypothetical protein